jgi:glycosyltransferase involved in cell wall biosynthesis
MNIQPNFFQNGSFFPALIAENSIGPTTQMVASQLPEVLVITSYPPRECGIATYSQDLLRALGKQFGNSFAMKVCALEAGKSELKYPKEVKYTLDTHDASGFLRLANIINEDANIQLVFIQHEFGFFHQAGDSAFLSFLYTLAKPTVLVFHTVLPSPDEALKLKVQRIVAASASIVVMTENAAEILTNTYGLEAEKIAVIAHGTHLVPMLEKEALKTKHGLEGRKILSTFGLLGEGKSIETTLDAMPAIIALNPDVLFLIIGKTHPSVVLHEGEKYRDYLEEKTITLGLTGNVKFINSYLLLSDLLEFLQLTDIYLFTTKDRDQAVSGTFSYAMGCGCPIVSTPIPHAREVLRDDTGILFDFQDSGQLATAVNRLMSDEPLRKVFSANALHHIVPTSWENSAIAHCRLLQKIADRTLSKASRLEINFSLPEIDLSHVKKMTTDVAIIQFSKINQPDPETGYTLDDNARALVAMVMHFELFRDNTDLELITKYLDFIQFCQQPDGLFLNYVDTERCFTEQNYETNLSDSNGRAIWALGFIVSKEHILPKNMVKLAELIIERAMPQVEKIHSTRAMAFAIKGLFYSNVWNKKARKTALLRTFADRLVQMYRHESETDWHWFEHYLTYGNSILPEAMLCAWIETGELIYRDIAKKSFDFLIRMTFNESGIKVISNKTWLQKGHEPAPHGEQPIDVAYTILALNLFYRAFNDPQYAKKMELAFEWFLGNNHLHQIIYNPSTGGCYDGLEEHSVNLNQGSESTVSYLMARLTMERHIRQPQPTSDILFQQSKHDYVRKY